MRVDLEVADIFRDHGPAWREANRGHVSLDQLKVMSAIERCRTAALGGLVARCENGACGHTVIAYNSCRNRHYGLFANGSRRETMARARELLAVASVDKTEPPGGDGHADPPCAPSRLCPCCGGRMLIVDVGAC